MPPQKDLRVQVVDMDQEMREHAEEQILKCFQSKTREEQIANEIKQPPQKSMTYQ